MTASGLVSRAPPVQTAVRNCTRDEGGPFGFGDQVADPKPPQAAVVKSHGGERCGNVGAMIPAGMVERGERKRTVAEVSEADVISVDLVGRSQAVSQRILIPPFPGSPVCALWFPRVCANRHIPASNPPCGGWCQARDGRRSQLRYIGLI
jgi:hypothetical protein